MFLAKNKLFAQKTDEQIPNPVSMELKKSPRATTWSQTLLGSFVMNSVLKRMPSSSPWVKRSSIRALRAT